MLGLVGRFRWLADAFGHCWLTSRMPVGEQPIFVRCPQN